MSRRARRIATLVTGLGLAAAGPPPDQEGRGCDPPHIFKIDSGALPAGPLAELGSLISGIPTLAGSYSFYVSMHDDPTDKPWCNQASAEREFTIKVVPGLVVRPESAAPGTVGVAHSLALTATLSDPKTWSIRPWRCRRGWCSAPRAASSPGHRRRRACSRSRFAHSSMRSARTRRRSRSPSARRSRRLRPRRSTRVRIRLAPR